ncbi:YbeD family protein [Aquimonas sp.]|jgi:putative lipoic acid-binding regulatory protein|uniref:YbeD family protein n=1 Tax=Aquimonas sp. TaxID=1872588 RepID=UPI0037BE470C
MDTNDPGAAPEQRGFEFPCRIEITAVGLASADWIERVTGAIHALGLSFDADSVRSRSSSGGKYLSVSLSFDAHSREDYDAAHGALRALPGIKWTL